MPRPRKYRRSIVEHRGGVLPKKLDPTAKNRMRAYRNRLREKACAAEETAARAACQARRARLYPWLPEFYALIGIDPAQTNADSVTIRAAWKRNAALLHPDRTDGDAAKAARLNELWGLYQRILGWVYPHPVHVP